MNTVELDSGREQLISGIAQDVDAEAQRILAEARRAAEERGASAQRQMAAILEEARRKAVEQAEALRKQVVSGTRMETKRIALRVREQAIRLVLEQVRARVEALIGAPEYREVLIGWIVEAAVGLNLPEAGVNASAREVPLLDEGLLAEAERKVLELTGRTVRLSKAQSPLLVAQGVVLTAKDGRLAFNNQVSTRLLRYQTEIRKAIYNELWKNE